MAGSEAYECDQLFLSRPQLRALTEVLPTPFYLYDEDGIRRSIRRWQAAFSWNAGYRQVFPLSRLPLDGIAAIFREEGCAVSCQDLRELRAAERWGFSGERVVYAPLWATAAGMEKAQRMGAAVSVDNPVAAGLVLEYPAETVSLCFNPGGKFRAGAGLTIRADGEKRGMTEQQILGWGPSLLRSGVRRLGLEAHLAVQTTEPGYYAAVAARLYALSDRFRRLGAPGSFCCLGGGPGLGFLPGLSDADPETVVSAAAAVSAGREEALWTALDRILTGPNAILVMRVLAVKHAHRTFAIVDADVPQFPRLLQGPLHHLSLLSSDATQGRAFCDVVGCRTDSRYRFGERRLLPPVEEGECCIVHDAGVDPPGAGCGCYLWRSDGTAVPLRGMED